MIGGARERHVGAAPDPRDASRSPGCKEASIARVPILRAVGFELPEKVTI